ncbi:MAG: tetratricopeptide repeat protein [Candidatus Latescibacteria bacterium]|nr:tetratricopeptide repeat protein [Candidatus Latescibacterota bacterium]MBT5828831.1 tetratricopeptide repeat protein [Candidatus Latescibacterota bacterium]
MYYNTFYNAKHSYQIAEQTRKESETPGSRLTPAVYRELYKRVIAKASAVLELYPKSKWVDNALLLIGKAFYWREEHSDALVKYQELQENFPNSELIPEAIYWQGLTLWALNRTEEARYSFSYIDEQTEPELFALANLALAEMEAESQNYESAIESYQSLITQLGKKHKLLSHAWQGIGNSHYKLGRYDEALKAYQNVLKSKPKADINFETRVQIGTTLEEQGKLDEALAAYNKILKIKRLRIYEAETQLKQANVFRLKEQYDTSEDTYQNVVKKYPRSKYSAEAYYRMGLISQQVHKDLETAKEYFEKSSKENRQSDAGQAALQRRKDLMSLERYRLQADDAKDPQKAIVPLLNLAELYLFNLGEIDSALATYQHALTLADTTLFAPKALYAIGLIYGDSLKNDTKARETFQQLIDEHSNTPYASDARKRLQLNRTDDALAEARFLEAENLKREGVPPNDYIPILQQVATEYPKSLYAPQALFAVAWAYENDLDQLDQAKSTYQQVKDLYPLTRFAEIADEKLSGDFLELPKPKEAPQDSTLKTPPDSIAEAPKESPQTPPKQTGFKSADEETAPDLIDLSEADEPPELVSSRPPQYPESAKNIGDKPVTVVVRLLIAKDGRVKKAEPLSGPDEFYSAAILSVVKYRFRPAQKADEAKSVWIELPIVFQPPN